MRLRLWIGALLLVSGSLVASPAAAQHHIADPAAMRQVIADTQSTDAANRSEVLAALERPDVRQLAEKLGVDLREASAAVNTLSGAELAELAAPARAINLDQTGGATTVVISLTTLLLIIIVVLLIAN